MTTIAIEPKPKRDYSDEEKREAVALHFLHGTQSAVSKATGIPQRTLSDWQKTDWWKEYERELIHACKDEQGAGYRLIVGKTQAAIMDRLDKGDLVIGRDGKKRRKPISAKDLTVIMAIATDKDRILRGEPTSISAKATDLGAAARDFERIAKDSTAGASGGAVGLPALGNEHGPKDPAKRH